MKYKVLITAIGIDAMGFLDMEGMDCIVIFNDDAPEDLAEICVLHTKSEVLEDPEAGDIVSICDNIYTITAVGEEAKLTLRELGHCTLVFRGEDTPDRPGCIMLDGPKPSASDIKVGGSITIF